ncbi:hypothetical protein [Ferrovibrio sp.]|uniref:hypothetical protein n=1 Tax=Ferrovibrio sp. TaxID=1917215 RepID=UPI0025B8D7E2|nr:hypothetical protein [Ferrovibrio sp.]MBX3454833.1 hypothetical protein [Ferrovibrio sp.]
MYADHLEAVRFGRRFQAVTLRKANDVLRVYEDLPASANDGDKAEVARQGAFRALLAHIVAVKRLLPQPSGPDAEEAAAPEIDEAALHDILGQARKHALGSEESGPDDL